MEENFEALQICVVALIGDGVPVCEAADILGLSKNRVRQIFYDQIDAPTAQAAALRTSPVGPEELSTIVALSRRGMPAPKIAHVLRRRLKDVKQSDRFSYC
jgi:hypothetical protein